MARQIDQCIANVEAVLAEAEMAVTEITRLNISSTDLDPFLAHADALNRRRDGGCRYSSTLVGVVRRLAYPELHLEFEATAVA